MVALLGGERAAEMKHTALTTITMSCTHTVRRVECIPHDDFVDRERDGDEKEQAQRVAEPSEMRR